MLVVVVVVVVAVTIYRHGILRLLLLGSNVLKDLCRVKVVCSPSYDITSIITTYATPFYHLLRVVVGRSYGSLT